MTRSEAFNRSGLSRFLNSALGRVYRLVMGIAFITVGIIFRQHILGIMSIIWGIVPLTAGAFDVCYISLALGGPFSGRTIREGQKEMKL